MNCLVNRFGCTAHVGRRGFLAASAVAGVYGVAGPLSFFDVAHAAAPDAGSHADNNSWPLFRGDPQSRGVAGGSLAKDPKLLWKLSIDNGAFEGTAAIANGRAYIGDLDGVLYALNLADGAVIWKTKKSEIGFGASPALRDDRIYIGDFDGIFYCLNVQNGDVIWQHAAEAEIDSSANFYQDHVLFGSQDASLYCLNRETGQQKWKFTIDDQIRCTPTVVANRAFVAGCDAKLHIVDLDAGKDAAAVEIDGPTGVTPAVDGDFVYFGTENGTFFAIDWKKATVAWTFAEPRGGQSFRSSAAVSKGVVVVGGRSKRVYAFDAATGKSKWTFDAKRRVDSSPVIVEDRVFVGGAEGRLYAFDLNTGRKVWEYETGGSLSAAPAVAAGRLIIASDDGVVYCFGEKSKHDF